MCTNFVPSTRQELAAHRLGVLEMPEEVWPDEVFPGYLAPIARAASSGTHVCEVARFGLVPPWCRDAAHASTVSRGTYNARSETAPDKPSFRAAWRQRQWALVPMSSFFEPCWESGHGVRWRITSREHTLFAAAALWERWCDPASGANTVSFSLLTINADQHPFMARMHRPGEEKRMLVVIGAPDYGRWLAATHAQAADMVRAAAQQALQGEPAPREARKVTSVAPQNLSLF